MTLKPTSRRTSSISHVGEDEETTSRSRKTSSSKKHVTFFTWSEDKCFRSCINENVEHTADARGLWGDPLLGNRSVKMTCSNCRQSIRTRVYFKPSWKSYVSTVCFSLLGCCCIPARYKLFHQGQHFCPLCQIYLGHTGTEYAWVRSRHVHVSSTLHIPHASADS